MYTIYRKQSFIDDLKIVKDEKSKDNIKKKIIQIAETLEFSPNHYKNLRKPLQKYKRVHVNDSFVMVFRVNVSEKTVTFYHYKHHDVIYNEIL